MMARTMFTYAPHRHRLPLIRSRISPGVSGGSAVRSSVTALGPGSASIPAAEQSWPGRAVAALERVVPTGTPLQRDAAPQAAGEALDRLYAGAVVGDREGEARVGPAAVDEHGAGAALAVVASFLRAGQPEPLAQQVEHRHPVVDVTARGSPLTVTVTWDISVFSMTSTAYPCRPGYSSSDR